MLRRTHGGGLKTRTRRLLVVSSSPAYGNHFELSNHCFFLEFKETGIFSEKLMYEKEWKSIVLGSLVVLNRKQ